MVGLQSEASDDSDETVHGRCSFPEWMKASHCSSAATVSLSPAALRLVALLCSSNRETGKACSSSEQALGWKSACTQGSCTHLFCYLSQRVLIHFMQKTVNRWSSQTTHGRQPSPPVQTDQVTFTLSEGRVALSAADSQMHIEYLLCLCVSGKNSRPT